MAKIKNWTLIRRNPIMYRNLSNRNIFALIGERPWDGKWDAWIQKKNSVTKWLVGGSIKKPVNTQAQAHNIIKKYMKKHSKG